MKLKTKLKRYYQIKRLKWEDNELNVLETNYHLANLEDDWFVRRNGKVINRFCSRKEAKEWTEQQVYEGLFKLLKPSGITNFVIARVVHEGEEQDNIEKSDGSNPWPPKVGIKPYSHTSKENDPQVNWIEGDGKDIPPSDPYFDLITEKLESPEQP